MKTKFAITCVLVGSLLGAGVALADDVTSMGSHAAAYVKDSAITTTIKTKLAAGHLTSLAQIHVDTDTNGVVWLSGTAGTRASIRQAFGIARHTGGVKAVHSHIKVVKDK
jgi:hyperosmotically inducible periplasmic protein